MGCTAWCKDWEIESLARPYNIQLYAKYFLNSCFYRISHTLDKIFRTTFHLQSNHRESSLHVQYTVYQLPNIMVWSTSLDTMSKYNILYICKIKVPITFSCCSELRQYLNQYQYERCHGGLFWTRTQHGRNSLQSCDQNWDHEFMYNNVKNADKQNKNIQKYSCGKYCAYGSTKNIIILLKTHTHE